MNRVAHVFAKHFREHFLFLRRLNDIRNGIAQNVFCIGKATQRKSYFVNIACSQSKDQRCRCRRSLQ